MTLFNTQFDVTEPFTNQSVQFGLTANVQLAYTVPGTSMVTYTASFKFPYDANVWVGFNKDASTPTENVSNSVPEMAMNPKEKLVRGGDVLNFLSNANVTDCGVEFFTRLG